MKVVITGGAGFLGRKLAQALLAGAALADRSGKAQPVSELVLLDSAEPAPPLPPDPRLRFVKGTLADTGLLQQAFEPEADSVFHLAAVVSAAAEADFDLGMRVNLDGTRAVLEACRAAARPPRLVFASSIAVFGGDLPEAVSDRTPLTPQTSYGTQKAIGELLVGDYSRKGFLDGRSLRLPTIVVRPGRPNRAASTFASSILREPLAGHEAVCPVRPESRLWILSPGRAIAALLHAHDLPAAAWGADRSVSLPGISVTVAEMVEALRRVAGEAAAARISWQPDERIQRIVDGWPGRFAPARALAMGFQADAGAEAIIRAHIEDELDGRAAA